MVVCIKLVSCSADRLYSSILYVFCATGALAACSYIPTKREKIFQVLYKALNSKTSELQEVAHDCMKNVSNNQLTEHQYFY